MTLMIYPCAAKGIFTAPPSKSIAHRLLICAGLSKGESIISNAAPSDDILATLSCLKSLGAEIREDFQDGQIYIKGANPQQREQEKFFCNESGSTLRFFIPLCLLSGKKAVLTGSRRLIERPLDEYEALGASHGFSIERGENEIKISGKLHAGEYALHADVSSQFVSGLLFALPLLSFDSSIKLIPPVESRSYILLTLDALKSFGVRAYFSDENSIVIPGNQRYLAGAHQVEGDCSSAAFFQALNALGGEIELYGLNKNTLQGDRVCAQLLEKLKNGSPEIELSDCPDLAPVLFAAAGALNGAFFSGTKRLAAKESNRVKAMKTELEKCGIKLFEEENSVRVEKGSLHAPLSPISSHNDHRIAMAMAVLLTLTGGELRGAEAVSKSMPDFFTRLRLLGIKIKEC